MLGRAFHITRISGIPLLVHWTFGFFFVWIAYVGYQAGMNQTGIIRLCLFALMLFVCVVLHEFGHALVARRYGIQTKDIIISPIGGVARLMKMPKKPVQELIIAIAGPAVNLLIAIMLGLSLLLFTTRNLIPTGDPARIFDDPGNFVPALFSINILLIVFNLVPAFPMDGGRIFRALLSIKWGRSRATKIAARVGQIFAIVFLIYAIREMDLILGFIAIFVFMSAANEYRSVYMDSLLSDEKVEDVYRSEFTTLSPTDSVQKALDLIKAGRESDFLVVDDKQVVLGVLPLKGIEAALAESDQTVMVQQHINSSFEFVSLQSSLGFVLRLFQENSYVIVPVVENDQIVGVVDRTGLNSYLQQHASFWRNWSR